jgi:hypothetical protein
MPLGCLTKFKDIYLSQSIGSNNFFVNFFFDLAKKNAPQHVQFLGKKWENIYHFKFVFGHISTTGSSK